MCVLHNHNAVRCAVKCALKCAVPVTGGPHRSCLIHLPVHLHHLGQLVVAFKNLTQNRIIGLLYMCSLQDTHSRCTLWYGMCTCLWCRQVCCIVLYAWQYTHSTSASNLSASREGTDTESDNSHKSLLGIRIGWDAVERRDTLTRCLFSEVFHTQLTMHTNLYTQTCPQSFQGWTFSLE